MASVLIKELFKCFLGMHEHFYFDFRGNLHWEVWCRAGTIKEGLKPLVLQFCLLFLGRGWGGMREGNEEGKGVVLLFLLCFVVFVYWVFFCNLQGIQKY